MSDLSFGKLNKELNGELNGELSTSCWTYVMLMYQVSSIFTSTSIASLLPILLPKIEGL